MISAHTGQYLSVDTAGASPRPTVGFERSYIVVMRCDEGIAPYIVVVETDNAQRRTDDIRPYEVPFISSCKRGCVLYRIKKTHRSPGVFFFCGFGEGGGMRENGVILF